MTMENLEHKNIYKKLKKIFAKLKLMCTFAMEFESSSHSSGY